MTKEITRIIFEYSPPYTFPIKDIPPPKIIALKVYIFFPRYPKIPARVGIIKAPEKTDKAKSRLVKIYFNFMATIILKIPNIRIKIRVILMALL